MLRLRGPLKSRHAQEQPYLGASRADVLVFGWTWSDVFHIDK